MAIPQVNMGMHTQGWSMDEMMGHGMEHQQQDDNWSNSSRGVPAVPNTLNVEDWYVKHHLVSAYRHRTSANPHCRFQFFGINGDVNGISIDGQ